MLSIHDNSGKTHKIATYKYLLKNTKREFSKPAQECANLLKEIFPLYEVCVEIPLPTNKTTFLDFYIPSLFLAIEVHGRQHTRYTKHFHGSLGGFASSCNRDGEKEELLTNNNITLIKLYEGQEKKWREILENWMNG